MFLLKHGIIIVAFVLLVIVCTVVIGGCSASLYKGPASDHFDGRRFFNKEPDHSFSAMVKWLWQMDTVAWPEWIADPPQPKPLASVNTGELRVTYINHATVLIQMDGVNILTDPIWSEHAGPFSWTGSKRVRAPGVKMEDLPKIDLILISHDHYDHLDVPTLKQLDKQFHPLILGGLGVKTLLKAKGFANVIELDWWQAYPLPSTGVKVTFVPALHTSGRGLFGGNRSLWGGFVIEGAAGRVYFAGDTAYGEFLDAIKARFPDFRLTIFPIGNYEKRWFMQGQHINPDDAVKAHQLLHSQQSMGIHFSTFVEHPEQTIDAHEKDLAVALQQHNVPASAFWLLQFREGRDVPK